MYVELWDEFGIACFMAPGQSLLGWAKNFSAPTMIGISVIIMLHSFF